MLHKASVIIQCAGDGEGPVRLHTLYIPKATTYLSKSRNSGH